MERVKILNIKVIKTDKIYVQNPDGTLSTRSWTGDYSKDIDSSPCDEAPIYKHVRFEKDGIPVVRELHISELIRKGLI